VWLAAISRALFSLANAAEAGSKPTFSTGLSNADNPVMGSVRLEGTEHRSYERSIQHEQRTT